MNLSMKKRLEGTLPQLEAMAVMADRGYSQWIALPRIVCLWYKGEVVEQADCEDLVDAKAWIAGKRGDWADHTPGAVIGFTISVISGVNHG